METFKYTQKQRDYYTEFSCTCCKTSSVITSGHSFPLFLFFFFWNMLKLTPLILEGQYVSLRDKQFVSPYLSNYSFSNLLFLTNLWSFKKKKRLQRPCRYYECIRERGNFSNQKTVSFIHPQDRKWQVGSPPQNRT